MIVTQPRIVAVDNDADHLTAILEAFQRLGMPCLGIRYGQETGIGDAKLEGVRVLFLDLHLVGALIATDVNTHYGIIADILQKNISPTGGPFVLVIWTEYADQVNGLRKYLDDLPVPEKPKAMPLEILSFSKIDFIDLASGQTLDGKADALLKEVEKKISKNFQLSALFSWEVDVQVAASATLAALMELVPAEKRNSVSYPEGLDEVLSGLASAAVGKDRVDDDPRGAISSVLAPMLADRIFNQENAPELQSLWTEAITRHRNDSAMPLTRENSGRVNRMLHVAVPSSETIRPDGRGTVVEFPAEWRNGNGFRNRFCVTEDELLNKEFKLKSEQEYAQCRLRLVRIGAACDHAQNRFGPIPYLLGIEIPHDVRRDRSSAAEWKSPVLLVGSNDKPFNLAVNARYSVSVAPTGIQTWNPVYRLREQLLMQLISHVSDYLSRPGIIELR